MFAFFKKKPVSPEQAAKENGEFYLALRSHIKASLSQLDMNMREIAFTVIVKKLAENLSWRLQHAYSGAMDRAVGEQYRQEARRLLKQAEAEETRSAGKGIESFCDYAAASLASCYLQAEALCFESPQPIDILQQEWLGQKKILRDINSMLEEAGLLHVGRALPR